jgi:hypothetical protein
VRSVFKLTVHNASIIKELANGVLLDLLLMLQPDFAPILPLHFVLKFLENCVFNALKDIS